MKKYQKKRMRDVPEERKKKIKRRKNVKGFGS
jgi:hypothetical protein